MVPVTFFYLMSFFKLFWFLFSFSWNCPERAKWVSPCHNASAQAGMEVQEEDLWGAEPCAGVSPGVWWTSTPHTLLKPRRVKPSLAQIQGNTRQRKHQLPIQPLGEENILPGAWSVPWLCWWEPRLSSLLMRKMLSLLVGLTWKLKDAQCLFILLENIMQKEHSSNSILLYLAPKESCRVLKEQAHVWELFLSDVGDKPESCGQQARGREQRQRNEWE